MLAFAKKKKPSLASILAFGQPVSLDQENAVIGFDKNSFYCEQMQEFANKTTLRKLCRDLFQREVNLTIVPIDAPATSLPESIAGGEAKKNNMISDGKKKPAYPPKVQDVLNIFGGEVAEIKTIS